MRHGRLSPDGGIELNAGSARPATDEVPVTSIEMRQIGKAGPQDSPLVNHGRRMGGIRSQSRWAAGGESIFALRATVDDLRVA